MADAVNRSVPQPPQPHVYSAAYSYGFRNFSEMMNNYKQEIPCSSEDFVCGDFKWSLKAFPGGIHPHALNQVSAPFSVPVDNYVGLALYFQHKSRVPEPPVPFKVKFRLSIVDIHGNEQQNEKVFHDVVADVNRNQISYNVGSPSLLVGGVWNFVSKQQLKSCPFTLLRDDILTVAIDLKWSYINSNYVDFDAPSTFSFPPKSNEVTFFNDPNFSDIKIEVGQKTFYASKLLLSQNSSVFKTMFSSGFREAKEGVIRIEDIDPNVFQDVLKFFYTGAIPNMEPSIAKEWLTICDRYDISSLKALLEKGLVMMLTLENAGEFFLISDQTSAKYLRQEALELIQTNWEKVCESDCFQRLDLPASLWFEMTRGLQSAKKRLFRLG